jgi:prepilin-type N-terminal cleavage/methylation domain-containing protein
MSNNRRTGFTLKPRERSGAFTLIELLVVMAIIAVLATLVLTQGPALLARAQLTSTMNNARQIYMAGFQMATDGTTNSDPNLTWPGDDSSLSTLEAYCNKLVQGDYLKAGDVQKILTAPGANPIVNSSTSGNVTSITVTGKCALKIYKLREVDASNGIFAASANFTYNTDLDNSKVPYGDKGFVILRKGGDASSLRKSQATTKNYSNDMTRYQNAIGVLPIATNGTTPPTSEDSSMVLTNPQ